MSERVVIYDTTLRDGAQTEGILFSTEDKLDILRELDSFGIDFIECGWPGANPTDDEFFSKVKNVKLNKSKLVAFGSTRRYGVKPEDDENLKALVQSPAEWCCIFGKSWDFQVKEALNIGLDENLDLVEDSVRFLVKSGKHVIFDAEHFFDGYKSDRKYALNVLRAAESGGAEWLVLCDTNGGSLPSEISESVEDALLTVDVPLGIHCHNDSDMATACSLAAVDSGCSMVQGTINGLGERCGNANLCTVIPNLVYKTGFETSEMDLTKLTSLSKSIGELVNIPPRPDMPYVGETAFTHKGGMHISAMTKNSRTYEHIDPSLVGNSRKILVSDMAGKASIIEKLRELGLECGDDTPDIAKKIKEMESKGYQFEGADASFELLVKRLRGEMKSKFTVEGFKILIDNRLGDMDTEASIKVLDSEGELEQTAADGNGPVNALDKALRKSLLKFFPEINEMKLSDYKVRTLDEKSATAAGVRVLIRSTDGKRSWTTVGVSENVVEASLIALVDALEYKLMIGENK
ncbi:MAG: citramalate synthase [Candidatus Methanomethylophilaceae archaeon]|nr:citramalate synthase [Candidatus Methanomethylophilaceae archaeon]